MDDLAGTPAYPVLGYEQPGCLTVAQEPADVRSAVIAWATDLGWKQKGDTFSFGLEPMLLPPSLHVDVEISREDDATTALFTALVPIFGGKYGPYYGEGTPAPMAGFLHEVGASFVAGVAARLTLE